jgi:hypothetical protein
MHIKFFKLRFRKIHNKIKQLCQANFLQVIDFIGFFSYQLAPPAGAAPLKNGKL